MPSTINTDINNTSACLNFVRLAQQVDIKPILGIDFRDGAQQLYLGLAKNNNGFHQLNTFLSKHKHGKIPFAEVAPTLPDVIIIYPFEQVRLLNKTTFDDNEYIGIRKGELSKLAFSNYSKYCDKLIALNSFTFRNKKDFNTHRLLRAIDNNVLLSKLAVECQASEKDTYTSTAALQADYKNYPHIIANTQQLMERWTLCPSFW